METIAKSIEDNGKGILEAGGLKGCPGGAAIGKLDLETGGIRADDRRREATLESPTPVGEMWVESMREDLRDLPGGVKIARGVVQLLGRCVC